MTSVGSIEHVALYGVAAAGEGGVLRDALLSNRSLLDRCGSGNGPISLLIEQGMSKAKAEKTMKTDAGARTAIVSYFAHVVDTLVKEGRIVEDDGVLRLGRMPRGYEPLTEEEKRAKSVSRLNLVGTRRKAGGWSNFTNKLDDNVVAQMAETMLRRGWPKGHTVVLDADDLVADGKHHIAAAELVGIDWRQHTKTITDELALWEEVEARNIDRWHGKPTEVAAKRAAFIALRPDLSVGAKMEALRESFPGTSERTQQRATSAVKQEVKEERDTAVKNGLASGKSLRQVAEETGVSKDTVARVAKQEGVSQTRQDGANETPQPRVLGTCAVCKTDVHEGEKYGHPIQPKPGFLLGLEVRAKGGANSLLGPRVVDKETFVHVECFREPEQTAYRGR